MGRVSPGMLTNRRFVTIPARLIESVRVSKMTGKLEVELQLATGDIDGAPAARTVAEWVNATCAFSGSQDLPDGGCVTVRIVDEAESQQLNSTFRQLARPTNVLAFPGAANQELLPKEDRGELGDIVICLPLVQREAAEQDKPPDAHLAHLVVHGTLHLLGFSHADSESTRSMEELEVNLEFPILTPQARLFPNSVLESG